MTQGVGGSQGASRAGNGDIEKHGLIRISGRKVCAAVRGNSGRIRPRSEYR